ncbi:MAG: Gfo/Idh/MocA family oxidoreductase [Alphaproteobacteria bacterium]
MRVVVAGLGVQGRKRMAAAAGDVVATVDPAGNGAGHDRLDAVPPETYDAVLACVPDAAKPALLAHALSRGKHVLVEKPLLAPPADLARLQRLAADTGAVCYTAYNHRFEPHFVRMAETIRAGALGRLYAIRLFYGNGTARPVRQSAWRDTGNGVIADLGSHLVDTLLFWLGDVDLAFRPVFVGRHENRAPDHAILFSPGPPAITLEMSLVSWRNRFSADVDGADGSAHIESLCKWGPATFTRRSRVLPSGRPPEEAVTLVVDDPTWAAEYAHFKALCAAGGPGNTGNDIRIARTLAAVATAAGLA